jgi:hypothetical protein
MPRQPALLRSLGMVDASTIVIRIVIGSGIFVLPNLVAKELPITKPRLSLTALVIVATGIVAHRVWERTGGGTRQDFVESVDKAGLISARAEPGLK